MHRPRKQVSSSLYGPVVAWCLLTLGCWAPGQAAEFTCTGGDVACLIEKITEANANGEENTILLEAGTYTLTAVDNRTNGPNGLPVVTSTLTIRGAGADATTIARGGAASTPNVPTPNFRIAAVAATGTLTLDGLTLTRGEAGVTQPAGTKYGGGVYNDGTLTLTDSAVTDSYADFGGGLVNRGVLTLSRTTVAHNGSDIGSGGLLNSGGTVTITRGTFAGNSGRLGTGGFLNEDGTVTITETTFVGNGSGVSGGGGFHNGGTATITNTTIARNLAPGGTGSGLRNSRGTVTLTNVTVADNRGGGIRNSGGTVTLQNSLLARNGADTPGPDCAGPVTSLGHTLVGDPTGCTIELQPSDLTGDPGLGDFADNGTPGNGHVPLLPTSQAIDAGNDEVCPETDQLGRPRAGPCDIGAIEFQPPGVDVVAIRRAIFAGKLSVIFVVATSSAAPEAELSVTVPDCLTEAPMSRVKDRYLLVRTVPECEDLDGHTATVTSSRGGMVSVSLR